MDSKKRRSALRKSVADAGPPDIKYQVKRRISFSGKHSVRVFHGEEEPKTYNNSYEISDHLNINETASDLCTSSATKKIQSVVKNKLARQENVDDQSVISHQLLKIDSNNKEKTYTNISTSNNVSVLSLTRDLINITYQNQNSEVYQIDYSADITLCEREKKLQVENAKKNDETNLYNFSFEDHEMQDLSIVPGEKTTDFIQQSRHSMGTIVGNDSKMDDFKDLESVCNKNRNIKEPVAPYMNEFLPISGDEQIYCTKINAANAKTVALQYDKENVNPFSTQNAYETQNYSCEMEIGDVTLSPSQSNSINFQRESISFQDKLNRLSILQETKNDIQALNVNCKKINLVESIHKNSQENIKVQNLKSRQTINFNNMIDCSSNQITEKFDEKHLSVYFNQSLEGDIETSTAGENNGTGSQENIKFQDLKSRQTINFNNMIDCSSNQITEKFDEKHLSVYFNQSMEGDIEKSTVAENNGTGSQENIKFQNLKSRQTINFNNMIDCSSNKITEKCDEKRLSVYFNQSTEGDIEKSTVAENNGTCSQENIKFKNLKSRQTINFNNMIDCSSNKITEKCDEKHLSVYFNQSMEGDIEKSTVGQNNGTDSQENIKFKNLKSRQTINFNNKIDCSSNKITEKCDEKHLSVYFNQSMEGDIEKSTVGQNNGTDSQENIKFQNLKSRQTINFNNKIDCSSNKITEKCDEKHLSVYFNQSMEGDADKSTVGENNGTGSQENIKFQNLKSRQTIYFNNKIDCSSNKISEKCDEKHLSVYFNQSMEGDMETSTVGENNGTTGAIPKVKLHQTQNFNQTIQTSPSNVEINFLRKNLNLDESSKVISNKKFSIPISMGKLIHQPKLVVRKMCTPLMNETKNTSDCEQQKLLLYKNKHQESVPLAITSDNATMALELTEKSLNFSLDTNENVSLSSESRSPLLPLQFKGYSLRQLNDEIECGKIKVSSDTAKTSSIVRKARISESNFQSGNGQLNQSTTKQTKNLHFEDVDITLPFDEKLHCQLKTANSDLFSDFNITQDEKAKNNANYRYSQADDIMRDNTSFLTKAKLSDETVSRNSSKKDLTQMNDSLIIFDDELMKADSQLKSNTASSCLIMEMSCTNENNTPESMFQSNKQILAQTTTHTKNYFINLCDTTNISNEIEKQPENYLDYKNLHPRLDLLLEKQPRQTIYFNNDITKNDLNEAKEIDTIENLKTSLISMDASIENAAQIENAPTQIEYDTKNFYSSIPARKTLYFNDEIPLEDDLTAKDQNNIQAEKSDYYIRNSIPTEIPLNKSLTRIKENVADFESGRLLEKGSITIEQTTKEENPNKSVCNSNKVGNTQFLNNKVPLDKTKLIIEINPQKDFDNEIELETTEIMSVEQNSLGKEGDKGNTDVDFSNLNTTMDIKEISLEDKSIKIIENDQVANTRPRKTLYFDDEISLENGSFTIDQKLIQTQKYMNDQNSMAAKTVYFNNDSFELDDTLQSVSKSNNNQKCLTRTPKNKGCNNICITPRLSLLEFTKLEKEVMEENVSQSTKYINLLQTKNGKKRPPECITPLFSMQRKRKTLVSNINGSHKKNYSPKYINTNVADNDAIDISTIFRDKFTLPTSTKERKSHIPIPINSGIQSYSLNDSSNHTTFAQRKDLTIEELEFTEEFVPASKISIFEKNPITISDVSVFFEEQKKSTGNILQTEMSLDLDKTDANIPNPTDNTNNGLENRFINLTLEDIDKTRLSLVCISYEDDGTENACSLKQENIGVDEQHPRSDKVINENVEIGLDFKSKHHKVNYLSNASLICRKCKRCQETLIDVTTSSTSETFTLPELPPLPDIGLNRLKQLRKLPNIADVSGLWKRVSLDRTIINTFHISDDDSQINDKLADKAEKRNSVVTEFILKYENDKKSFEMDLMEKQEHMLYSEKLPFVLRLNDFLSTNASNWIFDYQMQCQGILLFTHKKMLTFKLSLAYDEVDPLGYDISIKSVKLEKGHVPKKTWKPIDFVLDFQLKLNLPFNLLRLCKESNEGSILKMLQEIDRICLDTVRLGNCLQEICIYNQATVKRDECRTYVHKIIRKIVNSTNNGFKYVENTEIKVELLDLEKLSFKDIISPRLHLFREEIHLLPTGLHFLKEFLKNPLNYLKNH